MSALPVANTTTQIRPITSNANPVAPKLWTALDCPGQFAYLIAGTRTGPLGRITAHVKRPAPAGERYVVTGWRIAIERKKHFAGTAIFASDGELVAVAKSIWIGDVGTP